MDAGERGYKTKRVRRSSLVRESELLVYKTIHSLEE